MNEKAANDFIFLTDLSYDYGLIDRVIYLERIANLYELTDVDPKIVKEILPPFGQSIYNSLIENTHKENNENENLYEGSFDSIEQIRTTDETIFELYRTKISGKECRWEFYEKDADPHPSVPHGHGIQKNDLRLDPYTRKIFKKQNGLITTGLEAKGFIQDLWNDDNFRDYALRAIRNFITSGIVGKNYNWNKIRGITNPYRLPGKRR